jgi:hypothetical protein
MDIKITFDFLPVMGALLSVLAFVVPKFNSWYGSLGSENKQLFNVGLLAVGAVGAALLSYFGFVDVYGGEVWTWKDWLWFPLVDFTAALLTNAGVYKSTNYILDRNGKK